MPIRRPTTEEVNALQIYTGEGRMQCAKELRHYFAHKHLQQASTVEELKEVMLFMLGTPNEYIRSALEKANAQSLDPVATSPSRE